MQLKEKIIHLTLESDYDGITNGFVIKIKEQIFLLKNRLFFI